MFVAVMETGSFAKAATRLGTSSGQASKLVSRLEQELGIRLLNRTTRALSPTELGQAYFERIRQVLEDLKALDESLKSQSGAPSGRLRLTAPTSFGTAQLAPALLEFAARFPAIELDVNFTDRFVNLVDEGFDAGIRIGSTPDSTLVARKLCDARTIVLATPEYLATHGTPKTPDDLLHHDCIIDTNYRGQAQWRFTSPKTRSTFVVTVSGRLRFSNAELCLVAAEKGLGITRVPTFMAGNSLGSGKLVPLLKDFEDQPAGLFAIYPASRHLAAKVRALVDFLAGRFHGEPEWDRGW